MEILSPEEGFLGLGGDAPAPEGGEGAPEVVVIPFGLEQTVTFGTGTAAGPEAIIRASHEVELFDDELWCEPVLHFRVKTQAPFAIPEGIVEALALLEERVEGVVAGGGLPLVLGGEHSLTAGAIRPLVRRHPGLVIVHFDAHADLRDGYLGEHFSHAAALRRCLDHPGVSLESFGIRNISAEEAAYLPGQSGRVRIHWARERDRWDLGALAARLRGKPVWLTFDLDAFDAALMPATGTPEPGGLDWDEVMRVLRVVLLSGELVGVDVTELSPVPVLHGCSFLAARLAYRILGYWFCRHAIPVCRAIG
ncbi:MAG: arginase family protein [Magnetococcales bacterium]|nr:arginase family protein [Magnetococcales bacterium]